MEGETRIEANRLDSFIDQEARSSGDKSLRRPLSMANLTGNSRTIPAEYRSLHSRQCGQALQREDLLIGMPWESLPQCHTLTNRPSLELACGSQTQVQAVPGKSDSVQHESRKLQWSSRNLQLSEQVLSSNKSQAEDIYNGIVWVIPPRQLQEDPPLEEMWNATHHQALRESSLSEAAWVNQIQPKNLSVSAGAQRQNQNQNESPFKKGWLLQSQRTRLGTQRSPYRLVKTALNLGPNEQVTMQDEMQSKDPFAGKTWGTPDQSQSPMKWSDLSQERKCERKSVPLDVVWMRSSRNHWPECNNIFISGKCPLIHRQC